MKVRVITGIVAALVFIPFLIFSDTYLFVFMAVALSCIGEYEMLGCIGTRKKPMLSVPTFLVAVAVPLMTRLTATRANFLRYTFYIYFAYIFVLLAASVFGGTRFTIDEAIATALTTIYITFAFSSIVLLRDMNYGEYLYILAILTPWMCDIFAYFFGVSFGKHKLIPEVSPKKTVEGAIAGVVFGTIAVVLYGFVIGRMSGAEPRYLILTAVGIVLSLVSQCGDLIMSVIKRRYGVKDYGFILPGHGGILDRFDSIIATAPLLFIICSVSPMFELFI